MSSKLASDSCWESKGQFSLRAWHSTGRAPYLRIFAQHKLYLVSWERGWGWNWERWRWPKYMVQISQRTNKIFIKSSNVNDYSVAMVNWVIKSKMLFYPNYPYLVAALTKLLAHQSLWQISNKCKQTLNSFKNSQWIFQYYDWIFLLFLPWLAVFCFY